MLLSKWKTMAPGNDDDNLKDTLWRSQIFPSGTPHVDLVAEPNPDKLPGLLSSRAVLALRRARYAAGKYLTNIFFL